MAGEAPRRGRRGIAAQHRPGSRLAAAQGASPSRIGPHAPLVPAWAPRGPPAPPTQRRTLDAAPGRRCQERRGSPSPAAARGAAAAPARAPARSVPSPAVPCRRRGGDACGPPGVRVQPGLAHVLAGPEGQVRRAQRAARRVLGSPAKLPAIRCQCASTVCLPAPLRSPADAAAPACPPQVPRVRQRGLLQRDQG